MTNTGCQICKSVWILFIVLGLILTVSLVKPSIGASTKQTSKVIRFHPQNAAERMNGEVVFIPLSAKSEQRQLKSLRLESGKVESVLSKKAERQVTDVGDVQISPDGKHIAFLARSSKSPKMPAGLDWMYEHKDLWIYDRQTKRLTRLSTDGPGYINLHWSPDGRHLSVQRFRAKTSDLYVWNTRTGKHWLVADDVNSSQWAPDSAKLWALTNAWYLYIWRPGQVKHLVADQVNTVKWMQDSKAILFGRSAGGIFRADALGHAVVPLTKDSNRFLLLPSSPDGKRLTYVTHSSRIRGKPLHYMLSLMSLKDKKSATISTGEGWVQQQTLWSPDSKKIALWTEEYVGSGGMYRYSVKILSVPSGGTLASFTFNRFTELMGWTSDSKYLLALRAPDLPILPPGLPASGDSSEQIISLSTHNSAQRIIVDFPPYAGHVVDWWDNDKGH